MASELLLYVLAAASGAVVLVHLALAAGVLLNLARDAGDPPPAADLSVSVVVAARDEERNLPALLASLEAQSLRAFQVVLVDDRSRDGTAALIEAFVTPLVVRLVEGS